MDISFVYIGKLERKIFAGYKLSLEENVEYDGLEKHQKLIEKWLKTRRCIAIRPILLEFIFDQPAIDCRESYFGFCQIHSICPKRFKWH